MMTNISSNLPSQKFCKHRWLCFPNMPSQYFSFPEKGDKLDDDNLTTDHTDVAAKKTIHRKNNLPEMGLYFFTPKTGGNL